MDELYYQIDLLSVLNQQLGSNEKMYRAICDTSMNAFLYYNFEEDRLELVGNWEHFFKVEIKTLKDITRIYDFVEEKYVCPLRDTIFLEKSGKEKSVQECRSRDGKIWIDCEANVTYDSGGQPIEKVLRFCDVTKFRRQNDELSYLAYYDMLTGLYNRNYFIRILSDWVRTAKEENAVISVLVVDIDDFRKINDGMGMIVGDELIQQVGQFLGSLKDEKVMVSHINSDLYGIALYNPSGTRSVEHIYQTIRKRTKSPFYLTDGGEINISISVGVASYPEAGDSAIELINCAEIVMFKAKHKGKARIQYFDASILQEFLRSVELETKLKTAVAEENFVLYYQPQFDAKSGKIRGVEALLRWKDENGKMISPAEFIPIAEKNGLIVKIGKWVLKESISSFAAWLEKYHYDMILSINISAIQYRKQDFVSKLMELLETYNVPPNKIELEITESILIDDFEEVTQKMLTLRQYGIRVSMDDFGTGYSSLSYLKGLPIDTLKIDKSFIDTVTTDEATKTITGAMIGMVKKLGLETVAEGVETADQLAYLKSIDCDNIQGFLLGKPMPGADLEKMIGQQI